uniref:Large ribosomal subunit protein bL19c n=1 Tax=Nephroselmis astigmatica TaxID=259378 RepID=A0A088CII0_9CHLO|nr:ribosomal protein L19 [Nephroselmis astigmatica]AID67715.1 ribosomal protein L19 [Nephroselmis astigmatica]
MKTKELVETLESNYLKKIYDENHPTPKAPLPPLGVGDLVKVGVLIREGEKERIQPYEGTVIAQHKSGMNSTITVRKIFQGVGVERIFMIHSPRIAFIEVLRCSQVRRAKLYYLRDCVGKQTRLKERFNRLDR